jgi:hypothetical protein
MGRSKQAAWRGQVFARPARETVGPVEGSAAVMYLDMALPKAETAKVSRGFVFPH